MVRLRSLRRRNADSCEIRSHRAVAFQIKQARKSKSAKEAVPPSASPTEQQALRKVGFAVPTAIQNPPDCTYRSPSSQKSCLTCSIRRFTRSSASEYNTC